MWVYVVKDPTMDTSLLRSNLATEDYIFNPSALAQALTGYSDNSR